MKKSGWLYLAFGAVLYFVFLVTELPASWFSWGLNRYTHDSVRLDPLSGSLWHGQGRLVVNYPSSIPNDFGLTEWRINPLWLLTGQIRTTLNTESSAGKSSGTLVVSRSGFTLKDTDAVFPVTLISQLYPAAGMIGPTGKVRLRTVDLALSPQALRGNATLEWLDAGSTLSTVRPLGDYQIDITGMGKTANLKLTTPHGALALAGQGQWQLATGQLQFNGTATPREQTTEMKPFLEWLGADQGDGRRALSLNITLAATH
jgi:hypothetical protein